jgi:signal transduction histidine kinase
LGRRQFSPARGRITLTATLSKTCVRITVADTGIGIHPKDIPFLGRPFEQANNQLHDKPAGTGLGLTLSRRLVKLHGGELTITSEVGIGTRVTIRLTTTVGATVSDRRVEVA